MSSEDKEEKEEKEEKKDAGGYSRLISNLVRFGVGYRAHDSRRQYFAWHGCPSRNDDFITYAEITKEELKFPTSITRDILCSQRLDLTKISSLDKSAILCRSHQILHV